MPTVIPGFISWSLGIFYYLLLFIQYTVRQTVCLETETEEMRANTFIIVQEQIKGAF